MTSILDDTDAANAFDEEGGGARVMLSGIIGPINGRNDGVLIGVVDETVSFVSTGVTVGAGVGVGVGDALEVDVGIVGVAAVTVVIVAGTDEEVAGDDEEETMGGVTTGAIIWLANVIKCCTK